VSGNTPFLHHFVLKTINLPRQAPGKHKELLGKGGFLCRFTLLQHNATDLRTLLMTLLCESVSQSRMQRQQRVFVSATSIFCMNLTCLSACLSGYLSTRAAAVAAAADRKSLRLAVSQENFGDGDATNIMSNDVEKLCDSTLWLHYLWIAPTGIALIIGYMCVQLGVAAVFGSLLVMAMVPMQVSAMPCYVLNTINLPRQAPDKHKENSKPEWRFLLGSDEPPPGLREEGDGRTHGPQVRKNAFLEPFID
jgi:hypothetical protein